ncbi:class A beta-lactamase-related serine hydrolase [Oerskovia turbata]|uniref:Class A beta-lactamase-related serine hydrolase n=1 Tax=Oerskovia turbata TaxID=1713 RepID=A0A4Q1KW46_9CELL|nr:serine hydrolase domain-containing protein [Oerskovia turbata]RXR25470.1 class A beta-lactamase-related serine hydrolase [Oerskovia turbata]RXR33890.1 class A beta-lactamase-related serine hydrolase [Oerskovia turbata]TGJ95724.1 penicillin-binding protein [Actinotalea fermentans ATCC 43279 = JCM 9966 = DSM 3133]
MSLTTGSFAAFDDHLRRAAARDEFSGVVLVSRERETLFEQAYGVASRRWGVPVTVSTRFDVASVTKLFTSVAVLQQVAAGTLDLDASIHDYVDLDGTQIPREATLRHLLSHTSGIADDADEEAGESYEALWVDKPNYSVTRTADFLPQFVHKTPTFPVGEGCRYCNVGYVLAGLALERATGLTYRDYVREHVFARAGMTSSGFFDMREAVPDVAEGWEPVRAAAADGDAPVVGWRQNIYSYPPIGSPDGGAHVTAADLVRFLDAVRAGELLPPDLTDAFLSPQALHHEVPGAGPGQTAALHHAFGLEIEVTEDGSVRSLSKDGINTGSSAIVKHYPGRGGEPGVTIAVVSNSEDGAWDPIRRLDDLITGE